MQPNDPTILITAGVDQSLLSEITAKGFVADVIPFIKTESIRSEKVRQTIKSISKLNATIVFTSSNAVEAVHHFVQSNKVNWKIYCVGNSTKSLIENLFDSMGNVVLKNKIYIPIELSSIKINRINK